MIKRVVIFHGHLKELVPEPVVFYSDTVYGAVKGVTAQIKALKPTFMQDRHLVQVQGIDRFDQLVTFNDMKEIHIVPAFFGAGGAAKIIVGAVLVAVAVIAPYVGGPLAGAMSTTLYGSVTIGSMVFSLGVSMLLGGLLEMLSPAPKTDLSAAQNQETSKYMGANQNTTKIGTRIPLLVGMHMAYGHFIGFNVDAADMMSAPQPASPTPPPANTPSGTVEQPETPSMEWVDRST